MEWISIISIIAVISAPIISVYIAHHLQSRAEKRKDKMELFKTLMMSRTGWTTDSVRALNTLDIVFSDDTDVREAWRQYYDRLCVENPSPMEIQKIQEAQYSLLESMAISLGYKEKITWKTIQKPYMPVGMMQEEQNRRLFQDGQLAVAKLAIQSLNGMDQGNKQ